MVIYAAMDCLRCSGDHQSPSDMLIPIRKERLMSAKKKFVETVKKKLEAWKGDVERLQENANRINPSEMRQYSKAVQDIIARIQQVEKQFVAQGDSSADTWQALKRRVEIGCRDIEAQIKQVKEHFSL